MAPKRVLMTADTLGGVWTYALELTHALGDHGVEVALATMGALLTADQREAVKAIPNLKVFESAYRLEWMDEPWEDVRKAGEWLLWLERHIQPDVVHLNGYAHGALPWNAPMLIVGHSCVLSWWHAVKGKPAPNEMNRYWYEVERGLQAARLVVAPSRAMMLVLQYHYGPLPNCRVIPNGRAGHEFSPAAKEPFILSAGRMWDEAKNVEALAEVAPRLTWPVYIAGEEKHPSGFSALHHEHVHILGLLSPPMLAQWYSHAAIYALPARYEPFGLSALEAALAGCALVLGDIPTLRELWNEAALFVAPEDREGLAAALNALAADEPRRRELADKARARALEYPPQRMALGYLDAYRDIMSYQNSDREFAGTTG